MKDLNYGDIDHMIDRAVEEYNEQEDVKIRRVYDGDDIDEDRFSRRTNRRGL